MERSLTIKKQCTKEKVTATNFIKKFAAISLMVSILSFLVFPIGTVNAETSTNGGTTDVIQINTFYGDLSNDHQINSLDYALMKSLILDNSSYKKAADLNGDMSVNSLDLYIMKRYLLEGMNQFPVADTLVETQNGSVIDVQKNKTFDISLKENGSTGYQWFYTVSDPDALNLISEENIQYTNPEICGAPIQKTWTFEALKSGTYTMTYEYKRSWETGVEPIETVQYRINVVDPNEHVINVNANKTFDISLEENGSTGYQWFYTVSDPDAFNLISEKSIDNNDPGIVGAPIQKIWTFEALKSGTYTMTYEYKRPWETGVEPIETVQYSINVVNPNEHVINVSANKTFDISMQEGGFAGFTSTCKISDETAIELVSQVVDNPKPQIPDWLYSRIYTFKALKSGTYKIVFTPKPAGDDIVYVINVK